MSWAKIDDQFPHHPKIVTAGPIAELIHIRAICYCCRYLTDGFLPAGAVSSLLTGLEHVGITTGGSPGLCEVGVDAQEVDWGAHMAEHGLWHPCKGGFQVHDFLEYNPTKQQVLAAREATSKRVQSFRQKHPCNAVTNAVTNGVSNAPVTLLPSPSPSPHPTPIKKQLQEKELRKTYGEFQNVLLADQDIIKLEAKYGKDRTNALLERLSQYIASKGVKYKSHYATLLQWAAREKGEANGPGRRETTSRTDTSDRPTPPGKYAHLGKILDRGEED